MKLGSLLLLLITAIVPVMAQHQEPLVDFSNASWIWHQNTAGSTAYFRKQLKFTDAIEQISVLITADDSFELRMNGRLIVSAADWQKPQHYTILRPVAREESVIVIKANNADGAAGLICKIVAKLRNGSQVIIVSDSSWECADGPTEGWDVTGGLDQANRWDKVSIVGIYPCQPWGKLETESWDNLRARLIERKALVEASKSTREPTLPTYSTFKSKYIKPEYAQMYRSFVKLNPRTGLLEYEGRPIRPFFTVYTQPKKGGGWLINIPEFDFDLLEKDFARMKQANINVQVRFWNWSELLNYDGSWKRVDKQPQGHGLPYFRYNFEIYDYFLDRAQAHGLYVNIEPSFYWGLHPEVVPPQYRDKILLYDELWNATKDAYAQVLAYYSKRTVVVAVMVGEEDLVFDHCLSEARMLEEFRRFLKRKYGSVANLQRVWTYGYDYTDHSHWSKRTINGREVLWPEYPYVKGAFQRWKSFDDVVLPVFDYYRSPDPPNATLADMCTYQENLVRDPMWIDFVELREGMLVSRLNDLASALKSADPNHILFYSNPFDFNPAWHSLQCFNRGKLEWDVIGVGQHDSGSEPQQVSHWATCREYIQNVASYGPYVHASGASPKGFACGEGCGGKTRDGIAAYYPWWLVDIVGGGGAFFHSYDWNFISGRTFEQPTKYDNATLDKLGEFLSAIRHLTFTHKGHAEVLILRNKQAAFGMSAGYDFGNARYLASILYQLHIPFDIVPDSDIAVGDFEPGKINLNKYRFIFVPAQYQLLSSRTWQMLEDWISDPRHAGQRGLCFGLLQDQDHYFNPVRPADVHPAFRRLTGVDGYTRRMSVSGEVDMRFARFFGAAARGDKIALRFPSNGELSCFDSLGEKIEKILELNENGPAVVIRNTVNGNLVYTCGFYLGMAYNAIWGMEVQQEPYNVLNPLYSGMLTSVGVEATVKAPDNVGVYWTDDFSAILLKERFGISTDVSLALARFPCNVYQNATSVLKANGEVEIKDFRLQPYGAVLLKKAGCFEVTGGNDVYSVCRATPDGTIECDVFGRGRVQLRLELVPKTIYAIRQDNELIKVFTTDQHGGHSISLTLSGGSKPTHISVQPSKKR